MDRTGHTQSLRSTLADDPDYAALIETFIAELPGRIAAIEAAVRGADAGRLRTIAHQLKGAAPGYGFGPIGDAAASLEACIDASADGSLTRATDSAMRLAALCRSAASGAKPA
ncbi:MAG: Hpt domain-containing protein [Phycisphaerales bacterium]